MNSRFTDIFIKRPVLATVVSLMIFVLGLRAVFDLPVRQYPKIENTVVTVTTAYPGASANLVQGFITSPLEKTIATAEGIDYLTSETIDGQSTITANIKLNFDPNIAFTNVMSKVQEAKFELPKEAEDPVITKSTGQTFALMYIGFSSSKMSAEQITDYLTRVVQPKIETVNGVSEAQILGGMNFAMRIWLDPKRMAALGVSPADVSQVLVANNFLSAAGNTKGYYISIPINAQTNLKKEAEFKNLIIKQEKNHIVRLQQVARVELGSETYDASVYFNGKQAVFVAVNATPEANPLSVITDVKKILPTLAKSYPPTLKSDVVFDATSFIRASLYEVLKTIIEATIIVILIIFLFLGAIRTVSIPVVTIPLSLIGVFALMAAMGYSINLLTLLALVLAIGMVVDDAIVVVENIHRHIEAGLTPFDAAIQGAREIAFPVISMTFTLAAVYAPIIFMSGLTGQLFKEFAFTLAGAVVISGIVALTLSPMMCAYVFKPHDSTKRLTLYVDHKFNQLKNWYQRNLSAALDHHVFLYVFAILVMVSCLFLFLTTPSQLAPDEDQGVVWIMGQAPEATNINYMEAFTAPLNSIYKKYPAMQDYFIVNGMGGPNNMGSGFMLKPWSDRKQSAKTLVNDLNTELSSSIAGLQIQAVAPPPLPGSGLFGISFVITSVQPFNFIFPLSQELLHKAESSGLFLFMISDVQYNKPQVNIQINREKAAEFGITMQDLSASLSTAFGGGYVNRFDIEGQAYKVMPQLGNQYRLNPDDIKRIYVKTASGDMIPLSTFVTLTSTTEPNKLTHFQQLNSIMLQGMVMPGHALSEALTYLQDESNKLFPSSVTYNYAGSLRQYVQEGNVLMTAFMFSLIFIFLVLSAQFESFRDPLVVMLTVPMAICGALLPLNWGLATINIYTQVGLITLIGLISKHGILMVDFANHLREKDQISRREAIVQAAAIRLRPVLMTTAAMILGIFPLLIATGAGAASRFDIGLVIVCGMAIGTLFTLFIIPLMYTLKTRSILLFLLYVVLIASLLYFWFFILT